VGGRGCHSSNSHLNLSRFCVFVTPPDDPTDATKSAAVKPKSGRVRHWGAELLTAAHNVTISRQNQRAAELDFSESDDFTEFDELGKDREKKGRVPEHDTLEGVSLRTRTPPTLNHMNLLLPLRPSV